MLTNNKTAALKYFQHGTKNVSKSNPNSGLLSREMKVVEDALTTQRLAQGARDPMTTLPLEIVEYILEYFSYRELICQLRVSRSWKRVLTGLPPICETIAFPGYEKDVTPRMLLASMRRIKAVRSIRIDPHQNLDGQAQDILLDRFSRSAIFDTLQDFEVSGTCKFSKIPLRKWRLKNLVLHKSNSVLFRDVSDLLRSFDHLEVTSLEVELSPIDPTTELFSPSLKHFNLNVYSGDQRMIGYVSASISSGTQRPALML
jgi:hypothetical protein